MHQHANGRTPLTIATHVGRPCQIVNQKITVHHPVDLTLPLHDGPLRFAVIMKNGLTSYSWNIFTRGGDAYVVCRETMKDIKVSLHESGRQHIAFTKGSGHEMTPGSRFWNTWTEPPLQKRPPVPSVKLLFPSWGTTLKLADRPKWKDNNVLVEGDDEFVTAICLFVMDAGRHLRQTGLPSFTLGVLPLRTGKELHIIACRERPRNLKAVAEAGIRAINPNLSLSADMVGAVMTVLFTGDDVAGCPYLLPLLVDVKMLITADRQGAMAYNMCMQALGDTGRFTDPDPWETLSANLQNAWKVIGADWLRELPDDSKLAQLIAEGSVQVE